MGVVADGDAEGGEAERGSPRAGTCWLSAAVDHSWPVSDLGRKREWKLRQDLLPKPAIKQLWRVLWNNLANDTCGSTKRRLQIISKLPFSRTLSQENVDWRTQTERLLTLPKECGRRLRPGKIAERKGLSSVTLLSRMAGLLCRGAKVGQRRRALNTELPSRVRLSPYIFLLQLDYVATYALDFKVLVLLFLLEISLCIPNRGATVVWRLACSPPTSPRFYSRRGRSRSFASWNRAGRCRWSAGFIGNLPVSLPLHSGADSYSPRFTLVGFQVYKTHSFLVVSAQSRQQFFFFLSVAVRRRQHRCTNFMQHGVSACSATGVRFGAALRMASGDDFRELIIEKVRKTRVLWELRDEKTNLTDILVYSDNLFEDSLDCQYKLWNSPNQCRCRKTAVRPGADDICINLFSILLVYVPTKSLNYCAADKHPLRPSSAAAPGGAEKSENQISRAVAGTPPSRVASLFRPAAKIEFCRVTGGASRGRRRPLPPPVFAPRQQKTTSCSRAKCRLPVAGWRNKFTTTPTSSPPRALIPLRTQWKFPPLPRLSGCECDMHSCIALLQHKVRPHSRCNKHNMMDYNFLCVPDSGTFVLDRNTARSRPSIVMTLHIMTNPAPNMSDCCVCILLTPKTINPQKFITLFQAKA
ncbi:hypothetical protein PR048_010120 [Dryococelus australis]|uniref:Uncharacterized protein n=1 Tax=Dryococelus australis TaxID=614101 RepID=A0ABQ9I1U0_9NEOP|nr:hypothetical protein PR048_010120 [Dryococelus australis]